MGEFMSYLPMTVIITLTSSLFVAMVINPALAAIFLKLPFGHPYAKKRVTAEDIEQAGERPIEIRGPFLKMYRRLLEGALNHRLAVLLMSFLAVVAMFMVWMYRIGLEKSVEFFPNIEPNSIFVNLDVSEGTDIDFSDRISRQVEAAICNGAEPSAIAAHVDPAECYYADTEKKNHTLRGGRRYTGLTDLVNVKDIYSRTVAVIGGSSMFESNSPNHIGIQFHDLEERPESSFLTLEEIRKRIKNIPGAQITIAVQEEGPPTGAPINIEIAGDNFAVLGRISQEVTKILEKIPFVQDIRDDFVSGSPTVSVRVDRQKASLLGLSTEVIGFRSESCIQWNESVHLS